MGTRWWLPVALARDEPREELSWRASINRTADFLVITGEEVTTPTGHWLALGLPRGHEVDWRYRARDGVIGRHLAEVHDLGGLCVAAHPHAREPLPGSTNRTRAP